MGPFLEQVSLTDVRKSFGRYLALSRVTCVFRRGEATALLGANGAGKSTLLAILSTLCRPTSGTVLYDGLDHLVAGPRLRGRIGVLAHTPMVYAQMTSRENLLFFARLHGLDNAADHVEAWLRRLGLEPVAERPASQLSRGMAQRLSLARALINEPWLLLLDEPFTGLDKEGTLLLHREIAQAVEGGTLTIIVSHDLEPLDTLCSHVLVLRRGEPAAELRQAGLSAGQLRELYSHALR